MLRWCGVRAVAVLCVLVLTMSMDGGLNDNEHEMLNRIFNTVPVRRRNPPCCRWCVCCWLRRGLVGCPGCCAG